ncbi:MAG: RDD family protein [Bacilli bacterium]|nr:RDD family protein [Bacilli bacterium]
MEQNKIEKIENKSVTNEAPPYMLVSKGKRMLGALLDIALVALSGMILSTLVAMPIVGFQGASTVARAQIDLMNNAALETHLYALDENEVSINDDKMYENYFASKLSDDSDIYVNNDVLMYFHVEYLDVSISSFNVEVLGLPLAIDDENTSEIWKYDDDVNKPALLKDDFNVLLVAYKNSDRSQAAVDAYKSFQEFYLEALTDAREQYANLPATIAEYDVFVVMMKDLMARSALGSGFTFIIVAALFYLAIPLIKKDGRTLSKRVLGMSLQPVTKEKLSYGQIIVRGLLEIITFSIALNFVPFLTWGSESFFLPLFTIGDFSVPFYSIAFGSIILSTASLIVLFVSKKSQSIHDLATRTLVVDTAVYKSTKAKLGK